MRRNNWLAFILMGIVIAVAGCAHAQDWNGGSAGGYYPERDAYQDSSGYNARNQYTDYADDNSSDFDYPDDDDFVGEGFSSGRDAGPSRGGTDSGGGRGRERGWQERGEQAGGGREVGEGRAGSGYDDYDGYDDLDDFDGYDEYSGRSPGQGSDRGPMMADIGGPDAEGNLVTQIEVLNTVTTTPEQVVYRMSTRVGYPLRERTLDGDFQRLATMGVFDDIQIKKEIVPGGVKIIVIVREKDIIRRIEFVGNQQIKTKKLSGLIESKVGERFDAGKGNRDRRAIEDYLHKEYYYFGDVELDIQPFEDGVRMVFDIDEGGRLYVGDINFRGNTVFTRKELLAKMEVKRSGLLSRGKYLRRVFERDLERIRMSYLDKGYLDVRVIERPMEITTNTPKSRWQRRDVYLNVDIDEGEQYRVGSVSFDFLGTSLVPEESIREVIKTFPGEVYSPITIQEDAMKVRNIYGQAPNSRYFTRVLPEPEITEDGLVMDVTFRIQESPEVIVEGVRVTGLQKTKESVVLREFEVFPGEKIDSNKFRRSKENVENLGYFKDRPNVEIREGSAPDRAILVAELEEISTGKIQAGVGVSSTDSVVGSFGISQRNFDYRDRPKSFRDFYTGKAFRGGGQSFALNLSAGSKTQSASVNFTNPWIFGKPISMSMSAYYNNHKYDDDYHEQRYGFSLSYGKRLFDIKELTVNAGYRLEMVGLSNFDSSHSYEYTRQEGRHNVSRWITGINYDSRDSSWEPTRGASLGANLELAGKYAFSSKDFWRGFLSGQYFIPFFTDSQDRNWSLGFRGDLAYAKAYGDGDGEGQIEVRNSNGGGTGKYVPISYKNEVPYYERFHLGGVGSIRGFDYRGISPRDERDNAIGGEAMMSASVELFFPIWERMIRGSVFFDAGTVWRYSDDPGYNNGYDKASDQAAINAGSTDMSIRRYTSHTQRKFRTSAGFGVHMKTPLGPMPVRLYYAFPLKKEEGDTTQRFQFTMGALF